MSRIGTEHQNAHAYVDTGKARINTMKIIEFGQTRGYSKATFTKKLTCEEATPQESDQCEKATPREADRKNFKLSSERISSTRSKESHPNQNYKETVLSNRKIIVEGGPSNVGKRRIELDRESKEK